MMSKMFNADLKKFNFLGATINRTINSTVNHTMHIISITSNALKLLILSCRYSGSVRIIKSIVDKVMTRNESAKYI